MKIKLDCCHADTCLPDYWGGHHLAHISVPVYNGMMLGELKSLLRDEVWMGAIAGNDERVYDTHEKSKQFTRAMTAAINRLKLKDKRKRKLFTEVSPQHDDDDFSVYAYFVFVEME